jgi:hypothetical protein
MRKILGPKMKKVTGDQRKLYNKDIHDFYSTPNIVQETKSRKI